MRLYCLFQEETGKLKFTCLSNDGVDQHMVWYNIYAFPAYTTDLLINIYAYNIYLIASKREWIKQLTSVEGKYKSESKLIFPAI